MSLLVDQPYRTLIEVYHEILSSLEEPRTFHELKEICGVKSKSLAKFLDRLAQAGLIIRDSTTITKTKKGTMGLEYIEAFLDLFRSAAIKHVGDNHNKALGL